MSACRFGASSSLFSLNATIKQHISRKYEQKKKKKEKKYEQCDPSFTRKVLEIIYANDLTSSDSDMDHTFELYVKSKLRLKEAGINLRNFVTNSEELRERMDKNERSASSSEEVQPNGNVSVQVAETPVADVHKV